MRSIKIKTCISASAAIICMQLLVVSCVWTTGKQGQHYQLGSNELTSIALASNASEREMFAANELINYFCKITGEKLPLIKVNNSIVPQGAIAVGDLAVSSELIKKEELDSVGEDGFVIRINSNNGALCGLRDLGTLYGAYELLKQVGVKFYAHDCEIIPSMSSLSIPELNLSVEPLYDLRSLFKLDVYYPGQTPSPKLGYTPNDDLGYPGDLGAPEERNWVHSASFIMPYRIFGKENPEYFALQKNGQRYKPGDGPPGHLCLSNEEMRKAGAERLLHLIEKQKDRKYFVITQGDGRSKSWCHCDKCKAFDSIPGDHMTDRLLDYVNYNAKIVAENYPDKKILTLAYTEATARPSARILPDSNVMVMYCPYPPQTRCQSHGLDCPQNPEGYTELKGWLAKCPENVYIYDYPMGYNTWYEPFGSFYSMVDKMNYYSSNGIRGMVECVVPSNFTDLFIFVLGHLLWDANADVEALIDEFMSSYYGKAASAMREYFNFMHHEIDFRQIHQMCEGPNPDLVNPEYANNALQIFRLAQAAVANDSISLRRVERDKFTVLWSDINQRNTRNNELTVTLDEHINRLEEMVRIARDMKVLKVGNRASLATFKEWIRSIAPLWLQTEPWYKDPGVQVFLDYPENLYKY